MGALGAILGAFFQALFKGIDDYLSGQQARADQVALGQANQQLADNRVLVAAANAQTQAAVSAPKTVQGVEDQLDKGTF